MLYVATTNDQYSYTIQQVLTQESAPDDGLYVPSDLPVMDGHKLKSMISSGCCATIAEILNQLLSCNLSAWDVQVCIGRNPVKINNLGRKTLIADLWRNPGGNYAHLVSSLNDKILGEDGAVVSSWARIAISVAFSFGIYAELRQSNVLDHAVKFDVCVPDGDLSMPLAMLYASTMGLPIGKIIVCSGDNGTFWEFVNHGQLSVSQIPMRNRLAIQRLVYLFSGQSGVCDYISACERKSVFTMLPEQQAKAAEMLFAAVISSERIGTIIENTGLAIAPDAAVCYAGLQDYRAQTGQGRMSVMFGFTAPENQ